MGDGLDSRHLAYGEHRKLDRAVADKVKGQPKWVGLLLGATDPIRTGDLLITSELLYLLSHSSVFGAEQTQYSKFAPRSQEKIVKEGCGSTKILQKTVKFLLTKDIACGIVVVVGFGRVPEWPKGTDCKSAGFAFGGSNPPSPTK